MHKTSLFYASRFSPPLLTCIYLLLCHLRFMYMVNEGAVRNEPISKTDEWMSVGCAPRFRRVKPHMYRLLWLFIQLGRKVRVVIEVMSNLHNTCISEGGIASIELKFPIFTDDFIALDDFAVYISQIRDHNATQFVICKPCIEGLVPSCNGHSS